MCPTKLVDAERDASDREPKAAVLWYRSEMSLLRTGSLVMGRRQRNLAKLLVLLHSLSDMVYISSMEGPGRTLSRSKDENTKASEDHHNGSFLAKPSAFPWRESGWNGLAPTIGSRESGSLAWTRCGMTYLSVEVDLFSDSTALFPIATLAGWGSISGVRLGDFVIRHGSSMLFNMVIWKQVSPVFHSPSISTFQKHR